MQLLVAALIALAPSEAPNKLAQTYATAIADVNEKHARAPGRLAEDQLAATLPATARRAFESLLATQPDEELAAALAGAAEAALELDLEDDFARAREALERVDAAAAQGLGAVVSRERFLVRGIGGLSSEYLEHFADVFDALLGAYDEVFGFAEFSKVPGKKLRVRVHLEARIERPPHFAPQFPYHSEIDFPVADASKLSSPTPDGKFLFYGLAHELGHVIAMWGNRSDQEDHHAWAHYTGVTIVEHLAESKKHAKLLGDLKDVRWRSLSKERDAARQRAPSSADQEGVMALFVALHDSVGPRAIGDALNTLDAAGKSQRVNRVRYYTFAELEQALLEGVKGSKQRAAIKKLFP